MAAIAERTFSLDDQLAFAEMSADYNPMHLDAKAARRTQAGRVVVHGVHAVLWALDAMGGALAGLQTLTVRFDRMIYVGDHCRLQHGRRGAEGSSLDIVVDNAVVTRIDIAAGVTGTIVAEPTGTAFGLAGRASDLKAAFPNAAATLGADVLVDVAGLSQLVGMVQPGLHSIFRGFSVARQGGDGGGTMRFSVERDDERFNLITMRVIGSALRGHVEAFRRAPPVAQPSVEDLRGLVASDAFAGRSALVVGGSRGLGELTAKLLALGGAEVAISYAVGDAEAAAVAQEIRNAGGVCDVLRLDVRQPIPQQLRADRVFNQLYYFATPFIFGKRGKALDTALLDEMMNFYVRSFYDLCAHLRGTGAHEIGVFYPSSIAVESRPANLTEYAMAKAAGEVLCSDLPRLLKNVRVQVRRLPRLQTDQTSSVQPVETGSAIDEMLSAIKSIS
ncbi:SDR family NAD(P)-dependent oxidoreductase [Methylobacterium sp. CM6257]